MKTSPRLQLMKQQRIGVLILVALIALLEWGIHKVPFSSQNTTENISFNSLSLLAEDTYSHTTSKASNPTKLSPFQPNTLTKEQWMELGFSQKQAQTILNYKNSLGGFTYKKQLQKCYAISDEKYNQLKEYILLPDTYYASNKPTYSSTSYPKTSQQKIHYFTFNPNTLDEKGWQKLGFTEKQVATIFKYKKSLGGSFTSKDQIKKCFVISDEKFAEMEPYISIQETQNKQTQVEVSKKEVEKVLKPFNPNQLDREGWMALGFTDKQVNTIFNYKNKVCRGSFTSNEQLKKCYAISETKWKEIEPYIIWE